jgi:hypothetical protein
MTSRALVTTRGQFICPPTPPAPEAESALPQALTPAATTVANKPAQATRKPVVQREGIALGSVLGFTAPFKPCQKLSDQPAGAKLGLSNSMARSGHATTQRPQARQRSGATAYAVILP